MLRAKQKQKDAVVVAYLKKWRDKIERYNCGWDEKQWKRKEPIHILRRTKIGDYDDYVSGTGFCTLFEIKS